MRIPRRAPLVVVVAALAAGGLVAPAAAVGPIVDPSVPAERATEPVVLTGAAFPSWSAPAEVSVKAPSVAGAACASGDNACSHNRYEEPEVATGSALGSGVDVGRLLGFRWDGRRFAPVPLQVDEMAVRYLSNNASTFSPYSQTDGHPTYVFDEERFRWRGQAREDPCRAEPEDPRVRTSPDPVRGLDNDDEVVFMASDGGPAAPATAALPPGIVDAFRVTVIDPLRPASSSYVYVMRAGGRRPAKPAFTARNGYVRYVPDADSDRFLFSESAYESYGNAPRGAHVDPKTGACVTDPKRFRQRRPKDTAWVKTPRYKFRYDGRWLMTAVHVAPPGAANRRADDARRWRYGPDLVDQWKARAFQLRPGGTTPCCGYEEEVNNWGGSSMLMGWRAGPVRVIRATWGSDSATNNVRTETFYRDELRMEEALRVHPIPPADGLYSFWDFNAGKVDTYYNAFVPGGVRVDGRNDEAFGNTRVHAGADGVRFRDGDPVPVTGDVDQGAGAPNDGNCGGSPAEDACVDNDIDVVDPAFSGAIGTLSYEQVTGSYGTWVDRWSVKRVAAGAAYGLVTLPYYRDDACFDDGTGTDPGPHLRERKPDAAVDATGRPRRCWAPEAGDPGGVSPRDRFVQGAIGTHGIHIELIVDSDNALTTLPLDEISAEQRVVLLPGRHGNVGERYGRAFEKPLVTRTERIAP